MTTIYLQPPIPAPDAAKLVQLPAGLPLLAYLATSGHGSATAAALDKALAPIYPGAAEMEAAFGENARFYEMEQPLKSPAERKPFPCPTTAARPLPTTTS
ncbi:MAG: hypothetical protein HC850_16765 [Rhodomicrobium sp.]|nr:hypothetical protein [Rhodomicrobium sp.]